MNRVIRSLNNVLILIDLRALIYRGQTFWTTVESSVMTDEISKNNPSHGLKKAVQNAEVPGQRFKLMA